GAIGGVGFGIYLFYPAIFAFDQWDQLDPGAWLGLCSALTFIGASVATWSDPRVLKRPSPGGAITALVRLGPGVAGLFPNFFKGGGSYWSITSPSGFRYGHSYGILMIILVVLTAIAIVAAWQSSAPVASAVMLGGIVLGSAIALPDQSAFNHFGCLGAAP